jgi:dTDP-4-amino-4,6-dideoxygalactose transaminase
LTELKQLPKTKAIVPVHLFGAANMEAVMTLTKDFGERRHWGLRSG